MKIGTLKHYNKFERDFLEMYRTIHDFKFKLCIFDYINVFDFDFEQTNFIDSYKLLEEWNEDNRSFDFIYTLNCLEKWAPIYDKFASIYIHNICVSRIELLDYVSGYDYNRTQEELIEIYNNIFDIEFNLNEAIAEQEKEIFSKTIKTNKCNATKSTRTL